MLDIIHVCIHARRNTVSDFFCVGNTEHGEASQDACDHDKRPTFAKARSAFITEGTDQLYMTIQASSVTKSDRCTSYPYRLNNKP